MDGGMVASTGQRVADSFAKHQQPGSPLIRIKGERESSESLAGNRFNTVARCGLARLGQATGLPRQKRARSKTSLQPADVESAARQSEQDHIHDSETNLQDRRGNEKGERF